MHWPLFSIGTLQLNTSPDMSYGQFGAGAELSWVRTVFGPKRLYTRVHTSSKYAVRELSFQLHLPAIMASFTILQVLYSKLISLQQLFCGS